MWVDAGLAASVWESDGARDSERAFSKNETTTVEKQNLDGQAAPTKEALPPITE